MERILIFIKHHFGFLWRLIEWSNGIVFNLLFKNRLEKVLPKSFNELPVTSFSFRRLDPSEAFSLYDLIRSQKASDLDYFRPHSFDLTSIKKQFNVRSFLLMGTFDEDKLVGYFFLRFFANKKCFVGRLIDENYRGRGIGPVMNKIMYETAWRMGFRCLSTISRLNTAVMRAHAQNKSIVILKELKNDYLLVEFVKET